MILQALKEYYDRKASDPDSQIAPEGFEKKEIPFIVTINSNGEFISLEDTREKLNNRLTGKTFILPRSSLRQGPRSFETAFLLWDHIGYFLDILSRMKNHQSNTKHGSTRFILFPVY